MPFTLKRHFTCVAIAMIFAGSTGAAAQQSSDTETIGVDLVAAPICAVNLEYSSGSFGQWERSGTIWVDSTPEDGAVIFLTATITDQPQNGCDIGLRFGGLTGPGGSIPAEDAYFDAADDIGGTLHPENPASWNHTGVLAPEFRVGYGLQNIPATITTPGRYEGDVTIDVSNAV